MQIDIPAHIEKLLFLHDALIIPSFGGFTATRTPASADYVSGTVAPPSKTLTFSENLTVDDGILVGDIANAHGISSEEARSAVAEFVEKMQDLLNQREIVTLPGVGRLYKNYIQKIQFLADATNFNASSYGLPPLQFSPIARSREVEKKAEAGAEAPNQTPATTSQSMASNNSALPPMPDVYVPTEHQSGSRRGVTIGITVFLLMLAAAVWFWRSNLKKPQTTAPDTSEQTAEQPEKTAEPTTPPQDTPPATPAKTETLPDEKSVEQSLAERTETARQELKGEKGGKQCILVVATLQDKNNADRLQQLLKNDGYEVYFLRKNGYQVGIQFDYAKLSEVQEKINALQSLTGEQNIWIKKK
jgi:cell division septation protein DedD